MRLVGVAVPVPSLDVLTYSVPDAFADPTPGTRVLVPLGARVVTGIVVPGDGRPGNQDEGTAADSRTKSIIDVLDTEPFLPPDVVSLARWVAEYYACGLGVAMAAAMPPRAWVESERYVQITERGHVRLLTERGSRREALERLAGGTPMKIEAVARGGPGPVRALATLERDGLVSITRPLKGKASAYRTVRVAALTPQGHDVAAGTASPPRPLGPRQVEALEVLAKAPSGVQTTTLARRGIPGSALTRLVSMGFVTLMQERLERDPFTQGASLDIDERPVLVLTNEQADALETLRRAASGGAYSTVVLHGVTGSGKTEIYRRLAEQVRQLGRGVLLLVPEIALTPAVAGAFRRAFGEHVAIQHSGLSDGERHDQWQRIRRGAVDVVVGTRSAVFAPIRNLGLVIVDEEHDASYKQDESPRYHGRDVAVMRARQAGALAVLGSATPSMESYHNARLGRYGLVHLGRRVLDRSMAQVTVVDMREEYAAGGPEVILSRRLEAGLESCLSRGEQAIILLNRRGFASSVFCRECATTLECPNCSVSLTVHRAEHRARCHYCNHSVRVPKACPNCKGPFLEQLGFGTERVESEVAARLPGARVARIDRDTIRARGAITGLLTRFAEGAIDVIVGTQMIAKGHDFPRVTLVGVISADVGLGLADFRAAERTFQLLTQVAGRAGRGEVRGDAIIQTLYPRHYSIEHACRQDYRAFFADELTYRQSLRYPPTVAMVNAVVRAPTFERAMQDAGDLVRALRWGGEPYRVLGPAPAPLRRLRGEYRAQFFLKGTHRSAMREALLKVLGERPDIARRTAVDVDPLSVL
jgi:primosomal protein N' (replication factor Y)